MTSARLTSVLSASVLSSIAGLPYFKLSRATGSGRAYPRRHEKLCIPCERAQHESGPQGVRLAQPFRPLHVEDLALVDPDLHADRAVGRARLGEAVIDVGADRVQRELAVQVPFRARDLGPVQP